MGGRSGQHINSKSSGFKKTTTGGGGGGGGTSEQNQKIEKKIDSLISSSKKDAEKIHKGDVESWERHVYKDMNAETPSKARSASQIKKDVGDYIETEKIYKRENASMPKEIRWHISELGQKKIDALGEKTKTKKILISKINITQRHVFEKPLLKAIKSEKKKVVLFKHKGKYYLNDGNHRVAAAKLKGEKYIDAVIENVD